MDTKTVIWSEVSQERANNVMNAYMESEKNGIDDQK